MCAKPHKMLVLPDTRSTRNPEQQGYDCGLIAARCVLKYHGLDSSFADRLIPRPTVGITPDELINAFTLAGCRVAHGQWSLDTIKHARVPFIAYVNATDGIDHYVVVRGVGRNRVYFFDPDDGKKEQTIPVFMSRWHSVGPRNQLIVQGGMLIHERHK